MKIPDEKKAIAAGRIDGMLLDACQQCEAEPSEILDWAIRPAGVSLVFSSGPKLTFPVVFCEEVAPPEEAPALAKKKQDKKKPPAPEQGAE